ncbi:unnamed protein product, partial [Sphacelaria rigidula]
MLARSVLQTTRHPFSVSILRAVNSKSLCYLNGRVHACGICYVCRLRLIQDLLPPCFRKSSNHEDTASVMLRKRRATGEHETMETLFSCAPEGGAVCTAEQ